MNFSRRFALVLIVISQSVFALADGNEEGAFLDPAYAFSAPPRRLPRTRGGESILGEALAPRSETLNIIQKQTPVKAQGSRGTCSIFSATGLLESLLIIRRGFSGDVDLSEEWLEYLAVRNRQSDGSDGWTNFDNINNHGMPSEESFPYIGETWESLNSSELATKRCAHLTERNLRSCLLAHRDPVLLNTPDQILAQVGHLLYDLPFLNARKSALELKGNHIKFSSRRYTVGDEKRIKELLSAGVPLIMESSFYYGAWNHRKSEELGIRRNMQHWDHGVVFYPEQGSKDEELSPTLSAGHSIVIVGYDDTVKVSKTLQMSDGTEETFTHKGVYYFKNSWGVSGFGKNFEFAGTNFPGYGMMVQDYAHDYGTFFQMPLEAH